MGSCLGAGELLSSARGFFAAGAGGVACACESQGVVTDWSVGLAIHLPAHCHGSVGLLLHHLLAMCFCYPNMPVHL